MKKTQKSKKNIYIILGYFLMIIGLILPLGGFGSMTYRDITKERNYQNFIADPPENINEEKLSSYNEKIVNNDIIDPFGNSSVDVSYGLMGEDDVFAYLTIDAIDLKEPVYLGASDYNLSRGLCHVAGSHLPIGGNNTRSIIAGHRGRYGDILFLNLNYLKKGDRVEVERKAEKLIYEVYSVELVDSDAWDKVQPVEGEDILTLMTCDPIIPPYPTRLLVNCKRIGTEELANEKIRHKDVVKEDGKKANNIAKSYEEREKSKKSKKEVRQPVRKMHLAIYLITSILIFLLIYLVYRLVRYLKS